MSAILVKNADRMMTSADLQKDGIEVTFADGHRGLVPFMEIPEVNEGDNVASVELPNPYEVILHTKSGEPAELPWDFVRHYCDDSYRPRADAIALQGRQAIGVKIRQLRDSAGLTQEALARAAGIGRVTLVRIENGEQSPRYETLVSLAKALGLPIQELVVDSQANREEQVARMFMDSLGTQTGLKWNLARAEQKFPELANSTRWEFAGEWADESWFGLEVKSLLYTPGERKMNDWGKLVGEINEKLEGRLPGKYWLAGLPKYSFDHNQRQSAVDCLTDVINNIAPTLGEGIKCDIGPHVGNLLDCWPQDRRKQPRIDRANLRLEYPSHELLLYKQSTDGSFVGIGVGPGFSYWAEPTLFEACRSVLQKGTTNEQLKLAKNKGASKTVLLFDDRIDFDPKIVVQAFSLVDGSQLSHIDETYLVSTFGGEHVQQVWPENR